MIFFLALLPATMLTVAGFFVLYLSHRSEGGLRTFGRYLSFWAFTLAALVVLGSVIAAAHGGRMHGCMMHGCSGEGMGGQCPMMHPWHHGMPGPAATQPQVPDAAPGAPPPK